jgi:hypothetical protein
MRLCRSWLAFGLVSVLSAPLPLQAAVVYKWTDADGVVHFSDQPVPGAEKIVTDGGASHGIMTAPMPGTPPRGGQPNAVSPLASFHISIASPTPNQTFSGSEVMYASATVEPELQPNGPVSISWSLNGAPVAEAEGATHFTLPDLARGLYTISATLTDLASGATKTADPVTFNVLRPSISSPQHK